MKPNAFLLHSPYNTSLPKEYDVSWKQNLIEKLLLCFSNQIYIYIYIYIWMEVWTTVRPHGSEERVYGWGFIY